MAFKRVSRKEIYRCVDEACTTVDNDQRLFGSDDLSRFHFEYGLMSHSVRGSGMIQLDGRFQRRDRFHETFNILIGKGGYDFLTEKYIKFDYQGFNPTGAAHLLSWDWTHWESEPLSAWNETEVDPPVLKNRMIRLSDRYIYAQYATSPRRLQVYWCPLDRSSDWALEFESTHALAHVPHGSRLHICESSESGKVWICGFHGTAHLYDVTAKTVKEVDYVFYEPGESQRNGWYNITFSRELGVFVSANYARADGKQYLDVFVPEVDPYAVSTPIDLDTVEIGHASRIEVTVTAEHGEPVPDYPVNWSIIAGQGALEKSQSLTDEDGKAQVRYLPSAGATSVQIQASVDY